MANKNEIPLEERLLNIKYAIPVWGYVQFIRDITLDNSEKDLNDYKIIKASQMFVGFYHIVAISVISYVIYRIIDGIF